MEALTNGHVYQYTPRLTHLNLSPDFQGYGFDLQNEKDRNGHFIGQIEPDSPAGSTDLRSGDRVVEVNGHNVEDDSHQDLVERIKAANGSLRLLVADDQTYDYFLNNNIKVTEDLVHKKDTVLVNGELAGKASVTLFRL